MWILLLHCRTGHILQRNTNSSARCPYFEMVQSKMATLLAAVHSVRAANTFFQAGRILYQCICIGRILGFYLQLLVTRWGRVTSSDSARAPQATTVKTTTTIPPSGSSSVQTCPIFRVGVMTPTRIYTVHMQYTVCEKKYGKLEGEKVNKIYKNQPKVVKKNPSEQNMEKKLEKNL